MLWNILADIIVWVHFLWIVFMACGFLLTLWATVSVYIFNAKNGAKKFFDMYLFRTIHLCGIIYVGSLFALGKRCPLTILENFFRSKTPEQSQYAGSFIIHYLEKIIYPQISPLIISVPTIIVLFFSIAMFFIKPPSKFKNLLKQRSS